VSDVIQGIESGGYEWSDEEETKNEIRSSPRRMTPPDVKDALLLLQSMSAMNEPLPKQLPDETQEKFASRSGHPTASPRHSSQSSTLMISAGYKVPLNQQQTSSVTSHLRNEAPSLPLTRLTHRSSKSDQDFISQRKFVVSDFDDDMSSVSDQGDESCRNSLSG
jgi:hypothetical protein